MTTQGRVWVFGDNIDTDGIIPARYLTTFDAKELGAHCMEDVDPEFSSKVKPGDVLVAGKNFGCGSSREHAVLAIKGAGIAAVLAESFARIFFRNAINTGLLVLEADGVRGVFDAGDIVRVDVKSGTIVNETKGRSLTAKPVPAFIQEILDAGGLMEYAKKKLQTDAR